MKFNTIFITLIAVMLISGVISAYIILRSQNPEKDLSGIQTNDIKTLGNIIVEKVDTTIKNALNTAVNKSVSNQDENYVNLHTDHMDIEKRLDNIEKNLNITN